MVNQQYGTIGLDYNDGFISMSETDYYENLIDLKHFPLRNHGTGNKANSEIQEVLAKIVKIAKQTNLFLLLKLSESFTFILQSMDSKFYIRFL